MNITSHGISLKKANFRKLSCTVTGAYGLFLLVVVISLAHGFTYLFPDNPLFFFVAAALFLSILLFLTWTVLPFSSKLVSRKFCLLIKEWPQASPPNLIATEKYLAIVKN